MRREPDVQREQHRTGLQDSVIRFEQPMAIHAQKRNPLTGLHSALTQGSSQPARAFGKLGVGKPQIFAHHSGLAGELLFGTPEKADGRKGNIHALTFVYQAVCPPSTTSTWPVTWSEAAEARKTAAPFK